MPASDCIVTFSQHPRSATGWKHRICPLWWARRLRPAVRITPFSTDEDVLLGARSSTGHPVVFPQYDYESPAPCLLCMPGAVQVFSLPARGPSIPLVSFRLPIYSFTRNTNSATSKFYHLNNKSASARFSPIPRRRRTQPKKQTKAQSKSTSPVRSIVKHRKDAESLGRPVRPPAHLSSTSMLSANLHPTARGKEKPRNSQNGGIPQAIWSGRGRSVSAHRPAAGHACLAAD